MDILNWPFPPSTGETVFSHPLADLSPEVGREILDLVQTSVADKLNRLVDRVEKKTALH